MLQKQLIFWGYHQINIDISEISPFEWPPHLLFHPRLPCMVNNYSITPCFWGRQQQLLFCCIVLLRRHTQFVTIRVRFRIYWLQFLLMFRIINGQNCTIQICEWKRTTGNKKKSNILTTNRNTSMAFFLAEGKQKKYIVHQV